MHMGVPGSVDVDEKNLPNVEDDDPGQPDDEEEFDDLLGDGDDDDLLKDDEGRPAVKPESPAPAAPAQPAAQQPGQPAQPAQAGVQPAAPTQPAQPAQPADPTQTPPTDPNQVLQYTQAEIDRIVESRLGRDRKAKQVREIEAMVGMPLEQWVEQQRTAKVQQAMEQYTMTEDEAKAYVDNQERIAKLEADAQEVRERQDALARVTAYQQQRAQVIASKPAIAPLAAQFAKEVDEFTHLGTEPVTYEEGLAFVLGQKLLNGELLPMIQRATEQRTIANIDKRGKAAPINAAQTGATTATGLDRTERHLSRALGLGEDEWATEKAQAQSRRRRR